jgi:hypothetical protein
MPVFSEESPVLTASAQKVSEGFITLSWKQLGSTKAVTLQVANDPQLQQTVRSMALQGQSEVHLSGFRNGEYYAQLFNDTGVALGAPVQFQVQHRDLGNATLLFCLGAVLFAFLLALLVRFTRSSP